MTTYILAGGCFWCLDAVYRRIKGVTSYEQVSTERTGHDYCSIVIEPKIVKARKQYQQWFKETA